MVFRCKDYFSFTRTRWLLINFHCRGWTAFADIEFIERDFELADSEFGRLDFEFAEDELQIWLQFDLTSLIPNSFAGTSIRGQFAHWLLILLRLDFASGIFDFVSIELIQLHRQDFDSVNFECFNSTTCYKSTETALTDFRRSQRRCWPKTPYNNKFALFGLLVEIGAKSFFITLVHGRAAFRFQIPNSANLQTVSQHFPAFSF